MLKTLRLKNFQKFAKFILEFSPTFTTIVGSNDSGKSALFRSIQWVVLNKPSGVGFRKHGSNDTRVRLTTEKHRVERSRIASDNSYSLDGEKYKSFGAGVPEDVQKALGLMDSMNFQTQHDPIFWFSLTPAQLSAEVNKLVDLESIDYVNKRLRVLEKNSTWVIEGSKKQIAEHEKTLEEFEHLDDIEAELLQLEKKNKQLESLDKEYGGLESIGWTFTKVSASIEVLKHARSGLEAIAKLESDVIGQDRYYERLQDLFQDWKETTVDIQALKKEHAKVQASEKKCPTCGKPL
jgi:hypothetical protein